MTKKEFILGLIAKGMSDEEVIKAIEAGDAMVGIKPEKPAFAKMQFNKVKNPKPKVAKE